MSKYKVNNVIKFTQDCSFVFTNPNTHSVVVKTGDIVVINKIEIESQYSINALSRYQTVHQDRIDLCTEFIHEDYKTYLKELREKELEPIKQAIQHCEEKEIELRGTNCSLDHKQLGDWLRELLDIKMKTQFL